MSNWCSILSLGNNFLRMPLVGEQRIRWIGSISKHQDFDFSITNFNVCGVHFSKEVYTEDGKVLKSDAIPSIFENVDNNNHIMKIHESASAMLSNKSTHPNDNPPDDFPEDFSSVLPW